MSQIKKVKLDTDDFMERVSIINSGEKPKIIPGSQVTLHQNGLEIFATIGPIQTDGKDPMTCTITSLSSKQSDYYGVSIGQTIEFSKNNIFNLR